jgi:hypothetical protein
MASGKTLLADCIAILATGVSAPAMKYADTDEEATKTMLAVLAEGDQVVLIDNVERPLEGDTLCAVLTSEAYRQRVLGRTEMMSVPTTTLFLATGNHLVIAGDLRTRALLCRIDPKTEHPEQRQFNVELREWITLERPSSSPRGSRSCARSSPPGSCRRTTARPGGASSAGRTWCARRSSGSAARIRAPRSPTSRRRTRSASSSCA